MAAIRRTRFSSSNLTFLGDERREKRGLYKREERKRGLDKREERREKEKKGENRVEST